MIGLVRAWAAMVHRRHIDSYGTGGYRIGLPEAILIAVAVAPILALGFALQDLMPSAMAEVLGAVGVVWLAGVLVGGLYLMATSYCAARRYWRRRERGRL